MIQSFSLNPQQQEALKTTHGPLLISAGAGSGKTQVLISRIAHIISSGLAHPDEILAVTFTNKASREMIERVTLQLPDISTHSPLWISTFHSACARILRENISALAPRSQVVIYDSSDQLSAIKKIMKDLDIDEKYQPAKEFQRQINLCKRLAVLPNQTHEHPYLRLTPEFHNLYEKYEQMLLEAEAFDFESLLLETYLLFLNHDKILSHYQNKFKFISVDEYQDTNHIQYLLIKMLAQKHQNICVVGDEDQSIYSWRGADISNILNFSKDFPQCKVIKLEQNYRSTDTIVSAASSLIKRNTSRINKELFTKNSTGDLIQVSAYWTDTIEARHVVQRISKACERGDVSYNDFAIFYRTNAQSRVFEDQLRRHNIAYQIIGHLKFYDRAEIKDIISYFRFILNPHDELSLRRIINSPKRGIGKQTIKKAQDAQIQSGASFYECLLNNAKNSPKSKSSQNIIQFQNIMENFRQLHTNNEISPSNLYFNLLDATLYLQALEEQKNIESQSRIENLNELGNAIQQFEEERGEEANLETFLEQMSLLTSAENYDNNAVQLMTLHLSKGLEFDVVFITGLEEGLFPLFQNIDDINIEEERRLAYVGMTRAKNKLFLSYAQSRKRFGVEKKQKPSRFLNEVSQTYLIRENRSRFMSI